MNVISLSLTRKTMSIDVFPLGNVNVEIDGICECDCGDDDVSVPDSIT